MRLGRVEVFPKFSQMRRKWEPIRYHVGFKESHNSAVFGNIKKLE